MEDKPLIIVASARKESDTRDFVNKVFTGIDCRLADLLDFYISPYDYRGNYPANDDFPKLVALMLQHKVIVFATPVYWYAMSGLLKNFFDRFTDLVTVQKQSGRQLKGKLVFLLAVGSDAHLPEGFEVPFKLTAGYLGMDFRGLIYGSTKNPRNDNEFQKIITSFIEKLKENIT